MYVCLSVCALYLCLYVCLCLRLSGSLCLSLFRPHADKGRADRRPSAPRARKRTLCLNVRCETQDADMAQTIPQTPELKYPRPRPSSQQVPVSGKNCTALGASRSLSLSHSLSPSFRPSVCLCLPFRLSACIYPHIYIYTDIIYHIYIHRYHISSNM